MPLFSPTMVRLTPRVGSSRAWMRSLVRRTRRSCFIARVLWKGSLAAKLDCPHRSTLLANSTLWCGRKPNLAETSFADADPESNTKDAVGVRSAADQGTGESKA